MYLSELEKFDKVKATLQAKKDVAAGKPIKRKTLFAMFKDNNMTNSYNFKSIDEKKAFDAKQAKAIRAKFDKLSKAELAQIKAQVDADYQKRVEAAAKK